MQERGRWKGLVRILIDGIEVAVLENLVTDDGLDLLVSKLRGGPAAKINYLAWGDDATAPDPADSALGNETGRVAVTSQEAGTTGRTITTTYLGPSDAVGQIKELGWFAGTAATSTPGSGVLLARTLYDHLKTNIEAIQVERIDILEVA
jgi:hypothetical protein